MNYNLLFFIIAFSILILSIISICVSPIINGLLTDLMNDDKIIFWGTLNCQKFSDDYDYHKSLNYDSDKEKDRQLKMDKNALNFCKRKKAMYSLEYSSLNCDVILGCICTILSLLHYLEIGKAIEKKTGLIGIISGTIGFILTFIYIVFSGYILTNDNKLIPIKFPNRAYLKWNGVKYVPPYDLNELEDDPNIQYATFSELGQKQYNYDSELYKSSKVTTSEFSLCKESNYLISHPAENKKMYDASKFCYYIWEPENLEYTDTKNKYIYDRWVTSIILSVLLVVGNIGLILFGFFLFKSVGETGSIPIASSANELDNKQE